ncbi:hypothetical protein G7Y89_g1455 [Cudoniella acicularis]|uniref:BTB domain-containing protein n=1 Tax=Cudoniella acicularis TaxID=354080 RepID=A0A8H4RWC8_9HELO|nr:hypothetical protein G7Y89_g1455 [Cudoniella acicularis]
MADLVTPAQPINAGEANDVDEYPEFKDDDVLITSWGDYTWKLHSTLLIRASPFFKDLLSSKMAIKLKPKDKQDGNTIKWKIRLVPHKLNPKDLRFRSFEIWDPSKKNGGWSVVDMSNTENFSAFNEDHPPTFCRTYTNLFSIFCCGTIPDYTNDKSGYYYISDGIAILLAAEHIGALPSIRLVLEAYLLRLGQTLWHHVAHKSEHWSFVAARMRSPMIFREAMCHIVGKFGIKGGVDKKFFEVNALRQSILELAQKKHDELTELKKKVELDLILMYPPRMFHPQNGMLIPNRAVYGSDIYLWQARSIFSNYIASAFFHNFHHRARDGGTKFYRLIGEGGEAYLERGGEILEDFFKKFAMSGKGKVCLLDALFIIKDEMRVLVKDLLVDNTQAKSAGNDLPYLTCVEIKDEELPWMEPVEEPAEE